MQKRSMKYFYRIYMYVVYANACNPLFCKVLCTQCLLPRMLHVVIYFKKKKLKKKKNMVSTREKKVVLL